jgi:excisionase family DNA binding protein
VRKHAAKRLVRVMSAAKSKPTPNLPFTVERIPTRLASGMREAAASLGVSEAYLYKLARLGKLRLVRIGKRTLLPETERQRLIASATSNTT